MDSTKCRARSCNALNITEQESQWNLQMFTPTMKQETVQHLDEEEIPQYTDNEETLCNDYMSSCKPLLTSDCVDNSDCKFYVLEELKKEFPQPDGNRHSRFVFENDELSQIIERPELKQENAEESYSLIENEEIVDEEYPLIVKIESLEEHRVLDNYGDAGVHYDVLVAPQQVQCKLCSRTFKNRYCLLVHNNKHIKVVVYLTPVDVEMNELHKCKNCDEYFNRHDNMLAHVCNVHSKERYNSESYNEGIKPYLNRQNGEEMQYKCDLCESLHKSKEALVKHTKRIHVDYGRMFECRCGKKFHTPQRLSQHKRRQHNPNVKIINNQQFQCDSCHTFFKTKYLLIYHIKSIHYDYGKIFECSCGKQFRTPDKLNLHKKQQHGLDDKIMNNEQFPCDSCHKFFKSKKRLADHIKRIHYDYGKSFVCSCGKRFRTPIHLYQHNQRIHCAKGKNKNNEGFQCYICQKLVKTKTYLTAHIKSVHYDYGETFACWCGKQFRTPTHLGRHEYMIHGTNSTNSDNKFQCDTCKKFFKNKEYLVKHIKYVHYDYGKTFECWCGKQFPAPSRLRRHEYIMHSTYSENKFQCDPCGKFFKNKGYLARHIKLVHYDYGKMFSCWCGKQFSKPMLLQSHKRRQHNINIAALKAQFQCDICHKFFKSNRNLTNHYKNVHHDYGKVFVCVCGKQFRTPLRLRVHEKKYRHNNESKHSSGVNTNIVI